MPTSGIEQILQSLCGDVPEIDSFLVVSTDGMDIVAASETDADLQQAAASGAVLSALGSKMAEIWQSGEPDYLVLDGAVAKLISLPIGTIGVLILRCRGGTSLDNIKERIGRAVLDCARVA
jgi:predicted regulator of Ras-like GTPase activity (Roadblock/LC7/MglB family)